MLRRPHHQEIAPSEHPHIEKGGAGWFSKQSDITCSGALRAPTGAHRQPLQGNPQQPTWPCIEGGSIVTSCAGQKRRRSYLQRRTRKPETTSETDCKSGEQQGEHQLPTMRRPLPGSRDSSRGTGLEDENEGGQGGRQKPERREPPTACCSTVWLPIRSPSLRYFLSAMHHTFR